MSETYFPTTYSAPTRKNTVWATFSALALSGLNTLGQWQTRAAQRRHLLTLDDRMLSDIGISRAAALREGEKAFWRK